MTSCEFDAKRATSPKPKFVALIRLALKLVYNSLITTKRRLITDFSTFSPSSERTLQACKVASVIGDMSGKFEVLTGEYQV